MLMKFYFDTNCIRQLPKIPANSMCTVVTSFLAVFETISGMNSEHEFEKRRVILQRLRQSDVNVIWESPRSLLIRTFRLAEDDTDVEATKTMMNRIVDLDSFNDLKSIKFRIGKSEDYTIDTFRQFDKSFCTRVVELIAMAASTPTKQERGEYRKYELSPASIRVFCEMMVREFVLNQHKVTRIEDPRYVESINSYGQSNELNDYLNSIVFGVYRALSEGQHAGRNDAFDYAHIMYASHADYFVSDDTFYSRIPDGILKIPFITFSEFLRICDVKSS